MLFPCYFPKHILFQLKSTYSECALRKTDYVGMVANALISALDSLGQNDHEVEGNWATQVDPVMK